MTFPVFEVVLDESDHYGTIAVIVCKVCKHTSDAHFYRTGKIVCVMCHGGECTHVDNGLGDTQGEDDS